MTKFVPYANESDVRRIGNLNIENRLDRVSIDGDIELTLNKVGLADAKLLKVLLDDIISKLEAESLPDTLPPPAIDTVVNPFTAS
jgi:hypothetical protein